MINAPLKSKLVARVSARVCLPEAGDSLFVHVMRLFRRDLPQHALAFQQTSFNIKQKPSPQQRLKEVRYV